MNQSKGGATVSHLIFLEELGTLLIRGGWEGSTLLGFLTETFDTPDVYEVPFRKSHQSNRVDTYLISRNNPRVVLEIHARNRLPWRLWEPNILSYRDSQRSDPYAR